MMEGESQEESDDVTTGGDRVGPSKDDSRSANVDLPFSPSPEVLFLIKSHAKTISAINNISKKLEQLEVKVCDISKQSSQEKVATTKCSKNAIDLSGKCHQHSCAAHVLSDDSGGEYSRSTHTNGTATDEDELMSLLDQIGRSSQSIRDTRQVVNQSSLSRVEHHPLYDVHSNQHLQTATSQHLQTATSQHLQTAASQHLQTGNSQQCENNQQRLTSASGHPSSKTTLHQQCEGLVQNHRSSTAAINQSFGLTSTPVVHHPFNHIPHHVSSIQRPNLLPSTSSNHHHSVSSIQRPNLPPSTSSNHPPSTSSNHHHSASSNHHHSASSNHHHSASSNHHHSASLNALLFDPNVSRLLSSLSDELILDDPGNQKFLFGAGPSYTEHSGMHHSQPHHPLPFAGGVPGRCFQRSLPTKNHQDLIKNHHDLAKNHHDLAKNHHDLTKNHHDLTTHIPASVSTSTPVSSNRPSRRWEMDRALELVQKRKQDTVEAQYDLADQWLARQMNSKSSSRATASAVPLTSSSSVQGSSSVQTSSSSVQTSSSSVQTSSSSVQGSSSSNNPTTVTLRSPSSTNNSTTVKTSSLSQIPSSSRSSGQRVTINSTHPSSSSSQIQVTSNNNSSSTQVSSSTADIRHPIVNSNTSNNNSNSNFSNNNFSNSNLSNTFRSQTGVRSHHHLSPSSLVAGEHSSQSGLKGVPSSSSSSNPVAEVGSSSLLRKQAINSSRYNSSNSNHNHSSNNSNSSKR